MHRRRTLPSRGLTSPPRHMTATWGATRCSSRPSWPTWPVCAAGSGRSTSVRSRRPHGRAGASAWGASGRRGRRSVRVVRGGRSRGRNPGVDVRHGHSAERFAIRGRGIRLSQPSPSSSSISWRDPVAGLAEMARVTRRDGVVAACVWDSRRRPEARSATSGRLRGSSSPEVNDELKLRGGAARGTSPSCPLPRGCARSSRRR